MHRFPLGILALTALIACNKDDTGDSDTNTECDNQVISMFPADEEDGAYYRTTIEIEFDDAEDDASVTVAGPGGDVAGTSAWVGDTLVFTPTNPLSANTEYTTTVLYSCSDDGSLTATWKTSEVGAAVTASLTGRSYLLDLASGRFVQPEGVGDIIGEYLDQIVLIGVSAEDTTADTIDMLGALGLQNSPAEADDAHTADDSISGIEQDACLPSIPFPAGIDFSKNPYFSAGPADTTLTVAGFTVTVDNLAISGAFGPDASYIAGATLAGSIDTRPLVPLLSADPERCDLPTYDDDGNAGTPEVTNPNYPCDPATICTLAASLFVECESCSGGSATTCEASGANDACCLSLLVDSIQAVELLETDDSSFAIQRLSDPGSADAYDPCVVNADECASQTECL